MKRFDIKQDAHFDGELFTAAMHESHNGKWVSYEDVERMLSLLKLPVSHFGILANIKEIAILASDLEKAADELRVEIDEVDR